MAGILGDVVLFKIDTNPGGSPSYTILGAQKNAVLNMNQDLPDSSTKDSKDGSSTYWKDYVPGFKDWSVDADALIIEADTAYQQLETRYMTSLTVKIAWSTPGSATKYTGTTYIKSLKLAAPSGDLYTCSCTLQGSGVLVKA